MPEFEVVVKYTRRICATDEMQLLDAIDITQKALMSNDYKILEIEEIKENDKK